MRAFACLIFGFLLSRGSASAQTATATLLPGSRVQLIFGHPSRASALSPPLLRGLVDRVSGDSLYLRFSDSIPPTPVPIRLISQLWLSRGVSRGASAVRMGSIMALLGGLFGAAYEPRGQHENYSMGTGILLGALGGGLAGITLGILSPIERWKGIRVEGMVTGSTAIGALVTVSW